MVKIKPLSLVALRLPTSYPGATDVSRRLSFGGGCQKLKMIDQIPTLIVGLLAPLSHSGDGVFIPRHSYFFVDLLGFNESVFPGVSLLSRRR